MMKKLVVLMLVLGMASLASAVLTVELTGGGTSAGTFNVTASPLGGFNSYLFTVGGTIDTPEITFAGNAVAVTVDPDQDIQDYLEGEYSVTISQMWQLEFIDAAGEPITPSGNMGSFTALSAVDVTLVDASGIELDSASYIPEPMTMALLGIGGLFLRRRKK